MRLVQAAILAVMMHAPWACAQTAPVAPAFDAAWADVLKRQARAEEFVTSAEDLLVEGNVTTACSMANQARIGFDETAAVLKALQARPRVSKVGEAEIAKGRLVFAERHAAVKALFEHACE